MINHDSSFSPEMSVRVLHFQDDCSSHVSISSCTHFQMCFCNLQGSQSTEKAAIIIFGHSGIGEMVAHCAALMRSWSQWHFMSNESNLERHLGKAERGTWHLYPFLISMTQRTIQSLQTGNYPRCSPVKLIADNVFEKEDQGCESINTVTHG